MPGPEELERKPTSAEVVKWARNYGAAKAKTPPLVDVPTDIPGFSTRNPRGVGNQMLSPDNVQRLSELTREYAALDRDQKDRKPLVREDLINFHRQFPEIGGGSWDPDHGNFRVTVVEENHPKFDDTIIATSLWEKANVVYGSGTEVLLKIRRDLKAEDGQAIPVGRTYQAIRHALLGLGATEEAVTEVLSIGKIERLADRRDTAQLAKLIMEGLSVEGITFEPVFRLEIDDIDRNKPIKVRRPRRKNLHYSSKSAKPKKSN